MELIYCKIFGGATLETEVIVIQTICLTDDFSVPSRLLSSSDDDFPSTHTIQKSRLPSRPSPSLPQDCRSSLQSPHGQIATPGAQQTPSTPRPVTPHSVVSDRDNPPETSKGSSGATCSEVGKDAL